MLTLDTNVVKVNYGRPSMRGRKIMGDLVPWNKVWRTGANEATHLSTNFDMTIGGVPLPKGKYTLYTLPSPSGWQFIISKKTGQWGTEYDESQDYARFSATVKELPAAVETLTIALRATGATSGSLTLSWENTSVSALFEKNTGIRPISPLDSASVSLSAGNIMVKFSKPFVRGRHIWGVVVPNDSVWRTGANAATVLQTSTDLMLGSAKIPAGTYTLYSIPSGDSFTLIVNKKAPGRAQYDKAMDLVRIPMQPEAVASPIDPFRIWFDRKDDDSARLILGWADKAYAVVVTAAR
jgi:hypothetical protein